MPKAVLSEEDFIRMFSEMGAAKMAVRLGMSVRMIRHRRAKIEERRNINITNPNGCARGGSLHPKQGEHPARQHFSLQDGVVLIGSDAHYWPGEASTAHRAFVKFCKELKPDAVVLNGDVLDGASVSRHPPIGWENRPTLVDEIIACQTRLREIVKAAPKAKTYWTLGNHDSRFETRIATVAPEFAKIHGVHLKDHFGDNWINCWSLWINDDVVVKHRWKGGTHATHNNTLGSGKTMVTGHLHSLKVTPYTDYNGSRYGIDCGTLAETNGNQFVHYTEDNPVSWRSGFAVLTFHKGRLLLPELVQVRSPEEVEFRGKVWRV